MKAIVDEYTPFQLLLVDDSSGDVRLILEAFRDANTSVKLHLATDGAEATAFLRHENKHIDAPRPDLILLDLNLPQMDGRELLAPFKDDETLKAIPTVELTTSGADADIVKSYPLHPNCYLTKPVEFDQFQGLVKSINEFSLEKVRLPLHLPQE